MLLAVLVWICTVAIVWMFAGDRWWFPPPINEHAKLYDMHFFSTLIVTGVIFIVSQVALGWVIFRYRDSGKRASYSEGNNKLEVLWTSAAAVLFIGAVLMSTSIWAGVHLSKVPDNALRIEAVSKQFAFSFRYPGLDGQFGKTDIKQISDANANPFGVDFRDPAGRDDIQTSQLRVPAGVPVMLILKSRDVIHNLFVRELRLKQDLVPGMEIPLHFVADVPGTYEISCSELCGLGHHQMRSELVVLPPAEFEAWRQEEDKKLKALFE
jgi:cytochrome c oxidase subunit 2